MEPNKINTRSPFKLYLVLGFLIALLVLTTFYAQKTGKDIAIKYAPLINLTKDIKQEVTLAHLWFEEVIAGDQQEDISEVIAHIDNSIHYTDMMQSGGFTIDGKVIAIEDSNYQKDLELLLNQEKQFKQLTLKRFNEKDRTQSAIGSPLDKELDKKFREFIKQTEQVESNLHLFFSDELKKFKINQWVILGIIFCIALLSWIILIRYIRNRNRTLKQLKDREENLNITLRSIGDAVITADINGHIRRINPVAHKITKWKEAEAIGKPVNEVLKIFSPDTEEEIENPKETQLDKTPTEQQHASYFLLAKDGEQYTISKSTSPIYDSAGTIYGTVIVFRDITQKHKEEQLIKENERKYRNFFHTSRDCVFITTTDGRWQEINDAGVQLFGYQNREELMKINVKNMYYNETERHQHVQAIINQGYTKAYPVKLKHKSGQPINTLISSVPLKDNNGKVIGFQGTIKDITHLKQTEEALRIEKNKLQQITATSPVGIMVLDTDRRYTFVNSFAEHILELSKKELVNKYFHQINWVIKDFEGNPIPDDQLPFKVVMKTKQPIYNKEHTIMLPSSAQKNLLLNAAPLRDAAGTIEGIIISFQDITERHEKQSHINYLNSILEAIRSINQTIIRGYTKSTLIKTACKTLTEIRGFTNAWLVLLDEKNKHAILAEESNMGEQFHSLKEQMKQGVFPNCIKNALSGDKIQFQHEKECIECFIKKNYSPNIKIILRLEHAGRIFGVLNVSLPLEITRDQKEIDLLEELADDLAFALHNLELRKKHSNAEKALIESEKTFRNLVENAFDAIYFMRDRHYEYVNHRFCEITGYSEKELTAPEFDFDALLTEESKETVEERYAARARGEEIPSQYEIQLEAKDGTLKYVELSTVSMDNKNEVTVMGIMRDTTQRRIAEQELIEAKRKAEESDRLKSSFLANMSHEIRTPMNGIMGFAQILASKKMDFEKQKEFLNIIENRSTHLLKIIDDIIDISKIEADKLLIEKNYFNINDLLQELHKSYQLELSTKDKAHINLTIENSFHDKNAELYSDRIRVEQILSNLLNNAVKFTNKGEITFGCKSFSSQEILFFVKDTGGGISKDKKRIIFERFRQADDSITRTYGGTGLGLSISKKLTELLGGKIWLKSEENTGTTFYFTLPIAADKSLKLDYKTDQPETETLDFTGKTILVVEDDITSQQYIKEIIAPTNATIVTAETGKKALTLFNQTENISLVLIDIRLPDISGLEVTKEIKNIRSNIPVIAQTAYALKSDKRKSLEAGCNDYISKPIKKDELLSIIFTHLNIGG